MNNVLDLSTLNFTEDHPQEEGLFIWKSTMSEDIQFIKVFHYPEDYNYGMKWGAYYGVPSMRGRNVECLSGTFCKVIGLEK